MGGDNLAYVFQRPLRHGRPDTMSILGGTWVGREIGAVLSPVGLDLLG